MKDHSAFVYDLESMDDSARAKVIAELDSGRAWVDPRTVLRLGSSEQDGRLLDPRNCTLARLIARPLPEHLAANPDCSVPDSVQEHIAECPDCRKWVSDGRPFVFELGLDHHEKILHTRIRTVLHHPDEWPQSYEAAVRHCERCSACNEWREYLTLALSCEGVRSRAKEVGERFAYLRLDEPSQLIDKHIAGCDDCQRWCFGAISCAEVRDAASGIGPGNSIEWKYYRHNTLKPVERYHLLLCESCKMWVYDNVERTAYSAPVFDILDGKTEPEESAYFLMSQICRGMKAAMGEIFSADRPRRRRHVVPDPRGMDTPIDDLDLSVRTFNCLRKAQCERLADVAAMTDDDLRAVPNFGKKCLWEIHDILEAYGVEARQPDEETTRDIR